MEESEQRRLRWLSTRDRRKRQPQPACRLVQKRNARTQCLRSDVGRQPVVLDPGVPVDLDAGGKLAGFEVEPDLIGVGVE